MESDILTGGEQMSQKVQLNPEESLDFDFSYDIFGKRGTPSRVCLSPCSKPSGKVNVNCIWRHWKVELELRERGLDMVA